MTKHPLNGDFDLSQIFIGREQQLDLFQIYLNRWKRLMFKAGSGDTSLTAVPSPNNKIQGLVVLLYGRGGFGKSTLLWRYHDFVLKENLHPLFSQTTVGKVTDWEFAAEGKRSLFNPPTGQELDATEFFKVLHDQLANALGKDPKQFKEYQAAVKAVEIAAKDARSVLNRLKGEERYDWLRGLAVEGIRTVVQAYVPGSQTILDNPHVAKGMNEVAKLTQEQISQVRAKLHDKLGTRLGDYLDPTLRLGLALGRDLAEFAKNFPLLIFFDTYEEIDEADKLLRIVIGAAGLRVGWIIAGRDNLWAGLEQIRRHVDMEYGYKDIVSPDRGLPIDFNVGGVGAFTFSDIKEFFDELCKAVQFESAPPRLTEEGAKRILDVTLGIPLAVKIAAGLYMETADLDTITVEIEGKREIVDKMVQRYLLHTRIDRSERAKLYGLALLRRADRPAGVAAALGLSPEEAKTSYAATLSLLHRRYSFIFTEKQEPSLHQEVRHFLRLWLLERHQEPDILAVNEQLNVAHKAALQRLEERRQYHSLKERLQDEEWVDTYLDLTQQQYWFDPFEGVRHELPLLLTTSVPYGEINRGLAQIGTFFEAYMRQPYRDWWKWASQSLIYNRFRSSSLVELERLVELLRQRRLTFPNPFQDYYTELEAALWWRLGETYHAYTYRSRQDPSKALAWYEKALTRLGREDALKKTAAKVCWDIADKLWEEEQDAEGLPFLSRAIELEPDNAYAYYNRGSIYNNLKEYERALADYNRFIEFKPDNALAYYNRGSIYNNLKEYERALADYNQALELDPEYARAYYNRGLVYLGLKNIKQAVTDFRQRWKLSPTNLSAPWMTEWAGMDKQYPNAEMTKRLEQIAAIDSQRYQKHYAAYICQGVAFGLRGKLQQSLAELEQAISLEPEEGDAYFWQGMFHAYQRHNSLALELIEKSLILNLPPILLTPLYWLEKDRPDFFEQYAKPLLEQYEI